ncbi:MAG: RNA-directed polymerase [Rhizobium sp.]|nr:RNA-directed polymerase [Rhizobium sp.]
MRPKVHPPGIERYDLSRSPFSQKPTKRDVGILLGESVNNLKTLSLPAFKEEFVVRRQQKTGKKQKLRDLIYPVSRLRRIHERLKFHLNKVKQPSYLFSPRKNRSQRDNAALHLDQDQYLTLDLKQFYPSTTASMVRRWFEVELGMYADVARLLTDLSTIDDKVSFGSPLTPVLCTLVHRHMFDLIADVCARYTLRYSLWVDDVTISGKVIPGAVVEEIRAIVRDCGLKSHKIKFRSGKRPVFITGVGVVGRNLVTQNALNLKIKQLWGEYNGSETDLEKENCTQLLLANLGTSRYIVGSKTRAGQILSDQMNSLRQKKAKIHKKATDQSLKMLETKTVVSADDAHGEAPF